MQAKYMLLDEISFVIKNIDLPYLSVLVLKVPLRVLCKEVSGFWKVSNRGRGFWRYPDFISHIDTRNTH